MSIRGQTNTKLKARHTYTLQNKQIKYHKILFKDSYWSRLSDWLWPVSHVQHYKLYHEPLGPSKSRFLGEGAFAACKWGFWVPKKFPAIEKGCWTSRKLVVLLVSYTRSLYKIMEEKDPISDGYWVNEYYHYSIIASSVILPFDICNTIM